MSDAKIIEVALERFQRAADAEHDQRQRESEDLNFEFDPWPKAVKDARGGYTLAGQNVPARPMVNIPMLDQPVQLVINQEKAAHLGIEVHPESDDADDKTAEVLQGLIRDIEVRSRAGLARSWAFERAVKCGRGYYRILKRFCNPRAEGPEGTDQELVVSLILNQASVYFDPDAEQPDKSDAWWAFVTQDLSEEAHKRQFPDSKLSTMSASDFDGLGDRAKTWIDEKTFRVAEYFTVETAARTRIAYDEGKGEGVQMGWQDELTDLPESHLKHKRDIETKTVRWRKINGVEVLDEEEWDGQYIPIVPVVGREYNIDGDRRWLGLIAQAKDAARLVNYAASTVVEKVAIDVKSPWIIAEGQEEGHEAEFARASVRPVPYVRYKPTSIAGQPTPPPERNIQGPNIAADIQLLQQAKEFVHAATFTFDPSLGNLPQKDRSGKAIQALQQQSDSGNSHYLDNLAEVSMTYEAKVLLDMIPKVYDRPERIARIIDPREEKKHIMLNHPFVDGDKGPQPVDPNAPPPQAPPQPGAVLNLRQQEQPPVKFYDLTRGRYGVVVTVGKSYQTRMQQGSDALGQLLQADPALMPIIGWRYFKYNDNIPGHNEIAEDLKKIRPPQLQDADDPAQAEAKLAQAQQQIQMMGQALKEATDIIEKDKLKVQAQVQIAQGKDATTLEKTRQDNETKIAVAELGAKIERLALFLEERARIGVQQHELGMASADAGHEGDLAQMAHQQAIQQANLQQQHALEQGDQQVAGSMAQADQGNQHAIQQIKAAPKPANGSGAP